MNLIGLQSIHGCVIHMVNDFCKRYTDNTNSQTTMDKTRYYVRFWLKHLNYNTSIKPRGREWHLGWCSACRAHLSR